MAHPLARVVARQFVRNTCCPRILHERSMSYPMLSSWMFQSKSSSSSTPPKKILNQSTLLLQDGLDIQELPVIIRRTDETMFPYSNHMYTGEGIRPATAEDETFKHLLHQCKTVKEVFKMLEIPGDKVTGYSASYALQRMCQLKDANHNWDDIDTFICTAVMNELYSTVRKEVFTLSNDTIHSLVKCFLNSESFSEHCAESVKEEIEKRIGDSQLSVKELCELSKTLRDSSQYSELFNHVWIHIGTSYQEIDPTNVALVCDSLPQSHKYITRMIEKQATKFWWKLTAKDVVSILNCFVRFNEFYGRTFLNFGRWLHLNVHDVKETDLMQILNAFIHFGVSDSSLIRALERYVPAKGSKLDTNLLALVMEYCRGRRYLSPRILDAAAMHFCDNGESYNQLQMFSILRSFGYLNYLPAKKTTFLLKVEKILSKEISHFETMHIAELLCSFAFVKKVPANFVQDILNPFFLSRVKALDEKKQFQAGWWLEMYQSSVMLETRGVSIPLIYKLGKGFTMWKNLSMKTEESRIANILEELLGGNKVKTNSYARNTVHQIDLEIHVKDRKAISHSENSKEVCDKRLALLIQPEEHYCVNAQQLLGQYAMRNRHLAILGYTVVELPYIEMTHLNHSSQRKNYLEKKLHPYLDL